jgi:hypothetical protein
MKDIRRVFLPAACMAATLGALSFSGCGPAKVKAPPSAPPASAAPSPDPVAAASSSAAPKASATPSASASAGAEPPPKKDDDFDPCEKSKPVPHPYYGILRVARCDQHMYLTMASVATQLGVECKYCHMPSKTDPKKEEYPVATPKKEIANWMSMHLMQAIKPADGSKIKCKHCHTDEHGKPVAKILGNPRDPVKAHEWMSLVMVKKFVAASGERLKCKSCHLGNYSTPGWSAKVILRSDQIPPHQVGGIGPAL